MDLHCNYTTLTLNKKYTEMLETQMCNIKANISTVPTIEQTYTHIEEDEKYYEIFDVISREVIGKIKNCFKTIKRYFTSSKVISKAPKRHITKRTEDDSGGDSDPDPDRSLTDSPLLRDSRGGVRV